jgi:DNA-binding IclR family transcriptional regulator
MSDSWPKPIQATETSFRVLEALKRLDGATVTELATELDLPKSTVHNHLATLEANEYAVRNDETYRVGLRLLELGEHTRNRMTVYEVSKPDLEDLADETGELANLAVEEHGRGIYLCRAEGDSAVRTDSYAGMRSHLHCTALGKAILAHRPRDRVDEILDERGLPERTDSTITDRESLYEELDRVRERGIAFDREERLAGLQCVAAPITTDDDRAIAAISVSGPTSRMQGERFEEAIPERLSDAANVIELNITFS